jgi:SSS family solute:Na+ symporter
MRWDAFAVFLFFFIVVTVLGFVAARWRRGDLDQLHEWGLAGRRFGTAITWFLLGGDLYTAYTFIAVPAAMYGLGAVNGFFAVPYTILIYPLAFVVLPRFWSVCKQHGYVTPADFVKGRFGSSTLALVVAFTGILATMPYIALQMFGIQVSLAGLGIPTTVPILGMNVDLPLIIAFIILAAYTYTSGLRAPAMIALVKDLMIFIVLFVAIIYIPIRLGGFGPIFDAAHKQALAHPTATPTHPAFIDAKIPSGLYLAYSTLALGSALALFLYPHALTGVLSSSSSRVVKRNMALLPAYSLMLGFLAFLGYMALKVNIKPIPGYGNNSAVPQLINAMFPSWFAGFSFAAISIGALVPAAVMSIAAANLFTRNIYKEYINPNATDRQESQVAKLTSLVVKLGALLFIIYVPTQSVINFQLLGGVWILQTLPAVFLGLYTRWFNRWALVTAWAAAMIFGTWMFIATGLKSAVYALTIGPWHIPGAYEAALALLLNLILSVILTPIFEALGAKRGDDQTVPGDYEEELTPEKPAEVGREALG